MTVSQTDSEKVTALLAKADHHWKEFDGNRELEWKANFVLWPALAGLTGHLNLARSSNTGVFRGGRRSVPFRSTKSLLVCPRRRRAAGTPTVAVSKNSPCLSRLSPGLECAKW
jgi:hypothetical protein